MQSAFTSRNFLDSMKKLSVKMRQLQTEELEQLANIKDRAPKDVQEHYDKTIKAGIPVKNNAADELFGPYEPMRPKSKTTSKLQASKSRTARRQLRCRRWLQRLHNIRCNLAADRRVCTLVENLLQVNAENFATE